MNYNNNGQRVGSAEIADSLTHLGPAVDHDNYLQNSKQMYDSRRVGSVEIADSLIHRGLAIDNDNYRQDSKQEFNGQRISSAKRTAEPMTRRGLVINHNEQLNDRQDSKQTTNLVRPANASVDFSDTNNSKRYPDKRHDSPFEGACREVNNQVFANSPRQIKWRADVRQCLDTILIYSGHADMLPMFSQSILQVWDSFV